MDLSIFPIRFYLFALAVISICGDPSLGRLTSSKCWIGASALAEFFSSDPVRQDRGPCEPDHNSPSQIAGGCDPYSGGLGSIGSSPPCFNK